VDHDGHISSNSPVLVISVNFYRNSTHRNFPEFWIKSSFESGEISIRKSVPYPKLFLSTFYLEFLEQGKARLDRSKFGANPNRAHCATDPTCQRRADRLTVPHPTTDDRAPVVPRPTCPPRRLRRANPAVLHYHAATRCPRVPQPGRCCAYDMPPHCSTMC
jgi:hypothetical protein